MSFGRALSYGLPIGVVFAASPAMIADDPDLGFLTFGGVIAAFAAALLLVTFSRGKAIRSERRL